jgi:hypothetical protein
MNKSETRAENIDLKHKKFPSEGELRLGVINNWGYKKLGNNYGRNRTDKKRYTGN